MVHNEKCLCLECTLKRLQKAKNGIALNTDQLRAIPEKKHCNKMS